MIKLIDIIQEKLILAKQKTNYSKIYFYHEALEDGYTIKFNKTKNTIKYSIDNCNTWKSLKKYKSTPEINKGECIYFKGENMQTGIITGIGEFESNKKFNVGGNIMSLIYGDDFAGKTELLNDNQFNALFIGNDHLVSAKYLLLPATKLTKECYSHMFYACKSLIEAPELPATKLVEACYAHMFNHCILLVKAPKLPATTLAPNCYISMFERCVSLNEITMLAPDISPYNCLGRWVAIWDLSETGTFTKAKGVDIPIATVSNNWSGIPEGWTVKEI